MKKFCSFWVYVVIFFGIPFVNLEDELNKWESLLSKHISVTPKRRKELNDFVDLGLVHVGHWLRNTTIDPLDLPPYNTTFFSNIGYGNITLYQGNLDGIHTIARAGNVMVIYNYPVIKIHMPIGFKQLTFTYKYYTELAGIAAKSIISGSVSRCEFIINCLVNVNTVSVHHHYFRIHEFGQVHLNKRDRYTTLLVDFLVTIIKPLVLPIIKTTVEKQVNKCLNDTIHFFGFTDIDNVTKTHGETKTIQEVIKLVQNAIPSQQVLILNEFFDDTLSKIIELVLKLNYDPLLIDIPSVVLSNGAITGLSSIVRKGSVSFNTKTHSFDLTIPIGFKKLMFQFDYVTRISSGALVGIVQNFIFQADIHFNFVYIRLKIDNFKITQLGKIEVKVSGDAVSFTTNILLSTFQPVWEPILFMTLEMYIKNILNEIVNTTNNGACILLGNCETVQVNF
ncbi:hypothetical protein FQR65_LT03794 [Abscondita terminalis]|nr:hypothetical protein FQR65_LT03794 [Abscondita terminalis]